MRMNKPPASEDDRSAEGFGPPLLDFWFRFSSEMLDCTSRFPKSVRFTVSSRIDNLLLDGIERITEARYGRNRCEALNELNLIIEKLRFFLRLSFEKKFISSGCYEHFALKLSEAGRMTGGWRKHCLSHPAKGREAV